MTENESYGSRYKTDGRVSKNTREVFHTEEHMEDTNRRDTETGGWSKTLQVASSVP